MSILGISFLNEIVTRFESFRANRMLNMLREMVMKALHQTGDPTQSMDGMDISLCIYNPKDNTLQFSGANNPLYLVRKDVIIEYKADRMPIGISGEEEKSFTNHLIHVHQGDWFYLFTDGYVDQFGGSKGKKFKYDPFKGLLLQLASKSPQKQKEIMESRLEQWMGTYPQIDDILVTGVRFH